MCEQNRQLYRRFLEFQQHKLKRLNGISEVDEPCIKTLHGYLTKLGNIELWFKSKPIVDLTEDDIRKVYNDLEDGRILTQNGRRFEYLVEYYRKIFRGKLFAMAGKKEVAKTVIEFVSEPRREVRFILEDDVRKILKYVYRPHHRLLVWLAFDIGENINSLLRLRKSDFWRSTNAVTNEVEYRVRLQHGILKRSRTPRSEITNFQETAVLLDEHLTTLQENESLFKLGHQGAKKFLLRAAKASGVKCQPNGDQLRWKDFRSGMACDLLAKGWSIDEVKARLGHSPSSRMIDRYASYFALNRHAPKAKIQQLELSSLQTQLKEAKQREHLAAQRLIVAEQRMDQFEGFMTDVAAALSITPNVELVKAVLSAKKRGIFSPAANHPEMALPHSVATKEI